MGGKALVLVLALVSSVADAAPRLWSTTTPLDTWQELSTQVADLADTKGTAIQASGGSLQLEAYATDGIGLVISTLRMPFGGSASFLSELEEGARDEERANELSYKSTRGERLHIVDIIYKPKPDEGQSFVRRFTGVASNFVTSTSVLCTTEGTECPSLLASFSVDESSFVPLEPILSRPVPKGSRSHGDKTGTAYTLGKISAFVLMGGLFWLWYRQKNRKII